MAYDEREPVMTRPTPTTVYGYGVNRSDPSILWTADIDVVQNPDD